MEKAGIYIAIGAAYTALEIAKQVLEVVKQTTGAIGWLIQQLVKSISSIFYLKTISLTINAQQAKKCKLIWLPVLTLFGKDYNANSLLSLGGDVNEEKIIKFLNNDDYEEFLQNYPKSNIKIDNIEFLNNIYFDDYNWKYMIFYYISNGKIIDELSEKLANLLHDKWNDIPLDYNQTLWKHAIICTFIPALLHVLGLEHIFVYSTILTQRQILFQMKLLSKLKTSSFQKKRPQQKTLLNL